MAARRYEEYVMWAGSGLFVAVVLVSLAVWSWAIPWAIAGGLVVALAVYLATRELALAFGAGCGTAGGILILGIGSLLSPGWHQGLL